MLPVSAWPPGPPGAQLSPFGRQRTINLACHVNGYILHKGAWIVNTDTTNEVVMFNPTYADATQQMGTGYLPGSPPPPGPTRPTHDQSLEAWRAWQRKTGINFGPIWPTPGRAPPNWDGWQYVPSPMRTLIKPCHSGLVLADGQNVVITGTGSATIIEAYSV